LGQPKDYQIGICYFSTKIEISSFYYTCTLTFLFQILTLKFLSAVLPSWDNTEDSFRAKIIIQRLFNLLGKGVMTCVSDPTLLVQSKC
jgi:hypothetical protein